MVLSTPSSKMFSELTDMISISDRSLPFLKRPAVVVDSEMHSVCIRLCMGLGVAHIPLELQP